MKALRELLAAALLFTIVTVASSDPLKSNRLA
jgi:hypothetical protein